MKLKLKSIVGFGVLFSRLDTITVQMGMNIYRIIDGVSLYVFGGYAGHFSRLP